MDIFYILERDNMCAVKKEYDIIYELGRGNWLDATAGEALILGYLTKDVELQMRGTALAMKILKVHYNSDEFSKVEAQASDVQRIIAKKKEDEQLVLFIDEICEYDGGKKSLYKWEYCLVLAKGIYQIRMMMPEYIGRPPKTENIDKVEQLVRDGYKDMSFSKLLVVEDSEVIEHQKMDTTMHYTESGKLVCHVVDFNHEDGPKRGMNITYFMDEYQQAMDTWVAIRSISNQKR